MVFRKQYNEKGKYIEKDYTIVNDEGKKITIKGVNRYDILSCERTESLKTREVGRKNTEVAPGVFVEEPILEQYVAVNAGWDIFESEEAAAESYGLIYSPIEQ